MAKTKSSATGRLAGKVALITGAAGNLGGSIVRRYLAEGATVVMSGRDAARTQAALDAAVADVGGTATIVTMDGANIESVRAGIADVVARHGRIDILVNNAGSAGPKQVLGDLPLLPEELEGTPDSETVGDAARNIMVVAWNLVRAAASAMGEGGSIINVSTIFSRTDYFGRAAYTVPKAALNILSKGLARELGVRELRLGAKVALEVLGHLLRRGARTHVARHAAALGGRRGTPAPFRIKRE